MYFEKEKHILEKHETLKTTSIEKLHQDLKLTQIGSGTFGTVCTFGGNMSEKVVVKIFKKKDRNSFETDPAEMHIARIIEQRIRASETKENIVHMRCASIGRVFPCLLMQKGTVLVKWVKDKSNRNLLSNEPRLSIDLFCALKWMHDNGILHGDINPRNIIVECTKHRFFKLKFCDFGSCLIESNLKLKRNQCTHNYADPYILVKSSTHVNERSNDIWSLGIGLIEALDKNNELVTTHSTNLQTHVIGICSRCSTVSPMAFWVFLRMFWRISDLMKSRVSGDRL